MRSKLVQRVAQAKDNVARLSQLRARRPRDPALAKQVFQAVSSYTMYSEQLERFDERERLTLQQQANQVEKAVQAPTSEQQKPEEVLQNQEEATKQEQEQQEDKKEQGSWLSRIFSR